MSTGAARRPPARVDAFLIAGLVVVSSLPYIGGLGFYSDDWSFLAYLVHFHDEGAVGVLRMLGSEPGRTRPVQVLEFAALYLAFGLRPLGHHLVNLAVLAAAGVAFHTVLRRLGAPRPLALAIPALFVLLPHYSTDRFWWAAFQANLSMFFYFTSLYADLRFVEDDGRPRRAAWKLFAILTLVASVLAYEVVVPLFVLNIALVWFVAEYQDARDGGVREGDGHCKGDGDREGDGHGHGLDDVDGDGRRRAPGHRHAHLALTLGALLILGAYKVVVSTRTGTAVEIGYRLRWFGELLRDATVVSFWDLGLALPRSTLVVLGQVEGGIAVITASAVAVGVALSGYLLWITGARNEATDRVPARGVSIGRSGLARWAFEGSGPARRLFERPRLAQWGLALGALGGIVFGLGYAIFLTNFNAIITATGSGNRVAIAAAVGVAIAATGLAALVAAVPAGLLARRLAFAAIVGAVGAMGTVVNGALGTLWGEAYRTQLHVLARMESILPSLEPGSTVILDGVCPYVGPAVVFESHWDLEGALRLRYDDINLRADVVTTRTTLADDGLRTEIYGMESVHPFGATLWIVDVGEGVARRLPDRAAAESHFGGVEPANRAGAACPAGQPGVGVPVL